MERLVEDVTENTPSTADALESSHCNTGLGELLSRVDPLAPTAEASYDDDDYDNGCETFPNPYAPTYIPEVLRLQPSELPTTLLDRAYNFCRYTTVANLRKMARKVGAPTSGAKIALSTAVFADLSRRLSAFSDSDQVAEWYRCCPCGDGGSYREWLESPRAQTLTWWKAPSDELLAQYHPARMRNCSTVVRDANASDDRALSVSEFARLACILTQHEDAKQALLDSQLNLTRAQLD